MRTREERNIDLLDTAEDESYSEDNGKNGFRYRLFSMSVQNAVVQVVEMLILFITVFSISYLGDQNSLAAIGIGSMVQNVLGFSLGIGLNSGLDTLVAQASGNEDHTLAAKWLHRAVFLSTCLTIPASLALWRTEAILLRLGQDPIVAALAGQYCQITVWSLWPSYQYNALAAVLRSYQKSGPPLYAIGISAVFHAGCCFLFVVHLGWGTFGAGVAMALSSTLMFLLLLAYVVIVHPGPAELWRTPEKPDFCVHVSCSWPILRVESAFLKGVGMYLSVAIPAGCLVWAEWWCFEVLLVLAGRLGVAALAVHTACNTIMQIAYAPAGGIGNAVISVVGNCLGEYDADQAQAAAKCGVRATIAFYAFTALSLVLMREPLAGAFCSNPATLEQMVSLLPVVALFTIVDGTQAVLESILRGIRRQKNAFRVKLITMWGIRLPAATVLALCTNLGLFGLWFGSLLGQAVSVALYSKQLWNTNWNVEVGRCRNPSYMVGIQRRPSMTGLPADIVAEHIVEDCSEDLPRLLDGYMPLKEAVA